MKTQAARILMIIGLLIVVISGCGQSNQLDNTTSNEKNTQVETDLEENKQSDAIEEEPVSEEDSVNEEDQTKDEEMLEASGIYVGLIDNHSIEVTVEGTPVAFQLSTEAIEQVESIEEGIEITFTYIDDPSIGQKTIVNFK